MLILYTPTPTLPRPRGRGLDLLVPNTPTPALTRGRRRGFGLLVWECSHPRIKSGAGSNPPLCAGEGVSAPEPYGYLQRVIYFLPGVRQRLTTYARVTRFGRSISWRSRRAVNACPRGRVWALPPREREGLSSYGMWQGWGAHHTRPRRGLSTYSNEAGFGRSFPREREGVVHVIL